MEKKPQSKREKNIAYVHNDVTEGIIKASDVYALKTLLYMAKDGALIEKEVIDHEFVRIYINAQDLCNYSNITLRTLKNNLEEMGKTQIKYNLKKKWSFWQLLYGATIEEGILIVRMNPELLELFGKNFDGNSTTVLSLNKLMKIRKNAHSLRTFLLLNRFNNYDRGVLKQKAFKSLDELNNFFQVNYKSLPELKSRVLNKIEKDLEGLIDCRWSPIYEKSDSGQNKIAGYILEKKKKIVVSGKKNPKEME